MCGRTACALAPCDLQNACCFKNKQGKQQKPDWRDAPNGKSYFPSYNIAPGAHTPVLLSSDHFKNKGSSERVIQPMQWGLIPSWHKGSANEKSYETNNCRAESMLEKMTYKVPLQKGRRCVILAEGFYEWKRGKDAKQPYYIYFPQSKKTESKTEVKSAVKSDIKTEVKSEIKTEYVSNIKLEVKSETRSETEQESRAKTELETKVKVEVKSEAELTLEVERLESDNENGFENKIKVKEELIEQEDNGSQDNFNGNSSSPRLLTMAGVFDVWKPPGETEPIYSYSVITVESSPAMSWIHHRMPAILESDEQIEEWLNFGEVPLNKASKLIHAITSIESHPVSNVVNNSRNNTPDCVKKIDPSKPKKSAGSAFMSAWLSKGNKGKTDGEPPNKKVKVS